MPRFRRSARFTRWLVALLCAMQLGLAFGGGAHARQPSVCGHASPEAIASLAAIDAGVFSDAWRAVTGGDDGCCPGCPLAGPGLPASCATHVAPRPVAVAAPAAVPLGAARFGPSRPPSTAPPRRS